MITTFTYDASRYRIKVQENRLSRHESGGVITTYTYEGKGYKRTEQPGGGTITTLVWDRDEYLQARQTPTAALVSTDTSTQGNWASSGPSYVYGSDGYYMPNATRELISLPSYANLSASGNSKFTWEDNASDVRDLVKSPSFSTTNRIAACDYSATSIYYDLSLSDTLKHQVALYLLDWDTYGTGRSVRIDVSDPATGAVLATTTVSSFTGGKYAVFAISGSVRITLTNLASGSNATLSGMFFGPST